MIAAVGRLKQGPERELAERFRKRAAQSGRSTGLQANVESLSEADRDYLLAAAYDRYVASSALIGRSPAHTPDAVATVPPLMALLEAVTMQRTPST